MVLNVLQTSSLAFLVPALVAFFTGQWLECALSFTLACTSVVYHADDAGTKNKTPNIIMFLDPLLARICVIVYTILGIMGSITSHGHNLLYVLGAIGGIASGSLYGIECLIDRYHAHQKNDELERLGVYMHVMVQQFGAWAWVSYLFAAYFSISSSLELNT